MNAAECLANNPLKLLAVRKGDLKRSRTRLDDLVQVILAVNHHERAAVSLKALDDVAKGPQGQSAFEMFGQIERDANGAFFCCRQVTQPGGRCFRIGDDRAVGDQPVSNAITHRPYPDIPIQSNRRLSNDLERELLLIGNDRYTNVAAGYEL